MKNKMAEQGLELYIHIPFCVRKCAYCDFLSFPADEKTRTEYVDALCIELETALKAAAKDQKTIGTVFLGGGTPSLLMPGQIRQIMETISKYAVISEDAEITMECNPGTLDESMLHVMRACGINRISLGLQSADDEELKALGRIHTWADFENSYTMARKAGFDNINVDLMFALPFTDHASVFKKTLQKTIDLHPEHISLYSLIVEEGTSLAAKIESGELERMPEEYDRKLYRSAVRLLKASGYQQYEISNFAREGYTCRHNEGYWTDAEYLGVGLGASGYYQGIRYQNTDDLTQYDQMLATSGKRSSESSLACAPVSVIRHRLTEKEKIEEFMFLGLRRMAGISADVFRHRFHFDLDEVYGTVLTELRALHLVKKTKNHWSLTAKGVDVSNYVLAQFLLDHMPLPAYRVSVRDLVEFLYRAGDLDRVSQHGGSGVEAMQLGAAIHRKLQALRPADYEAEVPLSFTIDFNEVSLTIEGRADGICRHVFSENGRPVPENIRGPLIEEIKSVSGTVRKKDGAKPVHLAQAKCYAAIYAHDNHLDTVAVRVTYFQTESKKITYFDHQYHAAALWEWFIDLLKHYEKWAVLKASDKKARDLSIGQMHFPFPYRKGQERLVSGVYRTIKQGKQLFVQAPTGSGKTLAALYPAIRAAGEGLISRIWYLTARTITRTVAEDAMNMMMQQGLMMRSVTLTARDRICIADDPVCDPALCPYAKGHYDRVNDALYELLMTTRLMDRQAVVSAAEKHRVCPYALSKDAAGFADVVICDYNYVLDPEARLQDYFIKGRKKSDLFLIDEAHNLIERARGMYSAVISKSNLLALRRNLTKKGAKERPAHMIQTVADQLNRINRILLGFKGELFALNRIREEDVPASELTSLLFSMDNLRESWEKEDKPLSDEFWDVYFDLRHFLSMYELMDERFCVYTQTGMRGQVTMHLYCLDPSMIISSYLLQGRASILYSATMLPIPYYEKLLTVSEDVYDMYAESPFDPRHLQILIGKDVTSLYRARSDAMYRRYAQYITKAVSAKKGHYMVYFPSYAFMEQVNMYLQEQASSDIIWLKQDPDMTEREKESFLNAFDREEDEHSLVGLCVLGGAFSEGIDLTGKKLIGVIVVGTGIPQVGNRLNLTKEYYDERGMDGFSYTYVYPGFNKVMQAVGRVIRTMDDVGIALLLDERFEQSRYRRLYPREWKRIDTCTVDTVTEKIRHFWNDEVIENGSENI